MYYRITLYNSKTKKSEIICQLVERREDPRRATGKYTILNWLKHIYGEEWFSKNHNFIGVIPIHGDLEVQMFTKREVIPNEVVHV